ncbi:type III restriction endonuclease subunit R [Lampropedia puyangensis]|uniref:Type III restriction endonuclease subunit R n=1 Tax=Lampropedia puyangensis TaxID=1330072 RepID=A0A4S8ETK6_9BURK|nr:helicase-related protein [Lampropedia puyangensis]THT97718.1 type III restriction endonuclease subunit R [Lampropedia puyangensis]
MNKKFKGWDAVASQLHSIANGETIELNAGQRASLKALAERLPQNGVIIADEVGMGKTRIATALTNAVIHCEGRVAILTPPGLGFQWRDELRKAHVPEKTQLLRSLWQFLKKWENDIRPEGHATWLEDDVVLISHAFCNWRLGENSAYWRWALLPTLYAHWRKQHSGRYPRNFYEKKELRNKWEENAAKLAMNAAENIVQIINNTPTKHPLRMRMEELQDITPWPAALEGSEYAKNSNLRHALEQAVGLGLGAFDLVIVDEAHKSRGEDSGLNRLLNTIILPSAHARRLLMTATPVELHAGQWKQSLARAGITDDNATTAIERYSEAVTRIQKMPSDASALTAFRHAAAEYQTALSTYVLRRDKREVEAVKQYMQHSNNGKDDYRKVEQLGISASHCSPEWRQAICAAEALSFVARGSQDQSAKRLRLTIGNGHGISAILDEHLKGEGDQLLNKPQEEENSAKSSTIESFDIKKQQRIDFWKRTLTLPFQSTDSVHGDENRLFAHPAIQKAVEKIEAVCDSGEKVLVFGRFTRPMQALVRLLNARQMLRSLREGSLWPQASVHQAEVAAVQFALHEQESTDTIEDINLKLEKQYRTLEKRREEFRNHFLEVIENNWGAAHYKNDSSTGALFQALKSAPSADIAMVARAIQEYLPTPDWKVAEKITHAFGVLLSALADTEWEEADDDEGDGELDSVRVQEKLALRIERLRDEYSRTESSFARLMNGNTQPSTRRLLQQAFNRPHSNLKVLVAQSVVGREGLNLHEACRTVVLLHAEWNPGVVEQQIGRVDRINSLWEKRLNSALADKKSGMDLPKIEVYPIVFEGTYDEANWEVLMQRWDDLRAQLHGVVITPTIAEKTDDETVRLINETAPRFSLH